LIPVPHLDEPSIIPRPQSQKKFQYQRVSNGWPSVCQKQDSAHSMLAAFSQLNVRSPVQQSFREIPRLNNLNVSVFDTLHGRPAIFTSLALFGAHECKNPTQWKNRKPTYNLRFLQKMMVYIFDMSTEKHICRSNKQFKFRIVLSNAGRPLSSSQSILGPLRGIRDGGFLS
jgi:hypothetical protein